MIGVRGAGGLVGVVGKRSLRKGGNVIRGGAWVLGERMAGSKKKKTACVEVSVKNTKKMLPLRVAYY